MLRIARPPHSLLVPTPLLGAQTPNTLPQTDHQQPPSQRPTPSPPGCHGEGPPPPLVSSSQRCPLVTHDSAQLRGLLRAGPASWLAAPLLHVQTPPQVAPACRMDLPNPQEQGAPTRPTHNAPSPEEGHRLLESEQHPLHTGGRRAPKLLQL